MANPKNIPVVGIICEFNPLHNGHAYLLSHARALVGDEGCVVCVMSGRSTQRGELAVADPYLRGQTAILAGADLVVELPFPWCSGSAQTFAQAGVHILHGLGVDTILFGSECGDITLLSAVAELTSSSAFVEIYKALCCAGIGTTVAYMQAIQTLAQERGMTLPQGFPSSNDLLGIAYLSFTQPLGMSAEVVTRRGQGYNDKILQNAEYPSATALRILMHHAKEDPISLSAMLDGCMPSGCLDVLIAGVEAERVPVSGERLLPLYHAYFRLLTQGVAEVAELPYDLCQHLKKVASLSSTPETFWGMAQTKHYTEARLRRGMLYALTGVRVADLKTMPTYTTLLAMSGRGRGYLSAVKKTASLPMVTKPADAPEGRQKELGQQIDGLFTLCTPHPTEQGALIKASPYVG